MRIVTLDRPIGFMVRAFSAFAVALFAITSGAAEATGGPALVAAVPLAGAPEGAQAYRVVYHSKDDAGAAIDVTGVVIIPASAPPAAGRDIVAWAHGTSGDRR